MNNIKTKIVGILNITPDSFSDGGSFFNTESAIKKIQSLENEGAEVIDIGAESTRPYASELSPDEEWNRLSPILEKISHIKIKAEISIDTRHPETAERAISAGVHWINDVSGFENPEMINVVKNSNVKIVFMHNLGIPANKQKTIPDKDNPVKTVCSWAETKIKLFENSGISKERLIFDPGIGFGKNAEQSLQLIKSASDFKKIGTKIMFGHSRKSFIALFSDKQASERDIETFAISCHLYQCGIDYLRVHDAEGNIRAITAFAETL